MSSSSTSANKFERVSIKKTIDRDEQRHKRIGGLSIRNTVARLNSLDRHRAPFRMRDEPAIAVSPTHANGSSSSSGTTMTTSDDSTKTTVVDPEAIRASITQKLDAACSMMMNTSAPLHMRGSMAARVRRILIKYKYTEYDVRAMVVSSRPFLECVVNDITSTDVDLQQEAIWIVQLLSEGDEAHAAKLIDLRAIPALMTVLKHARDDEPNLKSEVIGALVETLCWNHANVCDVLQQHNVIWCISVPWKKSVGTVGSTRVIEMDDEQSVGSAGGGGAEVAADPLLLLPLRPVQAWALSRISECIPATRRCLLFDVFVPMAQTLIWRQTAQDDLTYNILVYLNNLFSVRADDGADTSALDIALSRAAIAPTSDRNIVPTLLQLTEHTNTDIAAFAINVIGLMLQGDELQTQRMIKLGVLPVFCEILRFTHPDTIALEIAAKAAATASAATNASSTTDNLTRRGERRMLTIAALAGITQGPAEQIEQCLQSGIVPLLMQVFVKDESSQLQEETIQLLCDIACNGSDQCVQYICDQDVIPYLCQALQNPTPHLQLCAVRALSSIFMCGYARRPNPYVARAKLFKVQEYLEAISQAETAAELYEAVSEVLRLFFGRDRMFHDDDDGEGPGEEPAVPQTPLPDAMGQGMFQFPASSSSSSQPTVFSFGVSDEEEEKEQQPHGTFDRAATLATAFATAAAAAATGAASATTGGPSRPTHMDPSMMD